jgi:hypothetical protein
MSPNMLPPAFRKTSPSFERAQLQATPQITTKSAAALAAGAIAGRRMSFSTALALLALAAASLFPARAQKPASATADLPAGAMQAKATTACLECHEARIILQQRLSKAAWTKEVDKMTKWGAVVDPNDRDALIDYLSANFSPDKPAYEPQRTSAERSSGKAR